MKKVLVTLSVLTMVFGMVAAASASATDWAVYFKVTDQNNANYLASSYTFGTVTGALDGVDAKDSNNTPAGSNTVCFGAFDLGTGAAGNGYYKDLRAPGTKNLTWNFKLWTAASSTVSTIKLIAWNPTNYSVVAPLKMTVKGAGKSFVFDGSAYSTSTGPAFTWTFDATQLRGIDNALTFQLTQAVPEPGSMLALLSGLVGLAGYGIRRRK